jgi:hypothetical protein
MTLRRPSWNAVSNLLMLALALYQTYLMRFPPAAATSAAIAPLPVPAVAEHGFTLPVVGGYWPIATMAGLVVVNLVVQAWGRRRAPTDRRLFGAAYDRFDTARKEADRVAALPVVAEAKAAADQARTDLDAARAELKAVKREYAEEQLRTFAQRVQQNLALAKLKGEYPEDKLKDVRVTVRFAVYADLELAQCIERILKEHTGWPVELDGSNKPTLLPNPKGFKVLFDVGPMESFMAVAVAFDRGQLVDASVGVRRSERWEDSERLVVEVLPTTP